MSQATQPSRPIVRWTRRGLRWLFLALLWVVLVLLMLWATVAICFSSLPGASPRYARAILFVVLAIAAFIFVRPRKYRWAVFPLCFLLVLAWFFSLKPS